MGAELASSSSAQVGVGAACEGAIVLSTVMKESVTGSCFECRPRYLTRHQWPTFGWFFAPLGRNRRARFGVSSLGERRLRFVLSRCASVGRRYVRKARPMKLKVPPCFLVRTTSDTIPDARVFAAATSSFVSRFS